MSHLSSPSDRLHTPVYNVIADYQPVAPVAEIHIHKSSIEASDHVMPSIARQVVNSIVCYEPDVNVTCYRIAFLQQVYSVLGLVLPCMARARL